MSVPDSCIALTRWLVDESTGSKGTDWNRVFRLATAHEISPYVYKGLTALQRTDISPGVMTQFEQAYETSRRRNLILRDEFLFILKRLRQQGIELIPYKEPLSFALVCPDIGMRKFKDVDFLVANEDLNGIHTVLTSLGYQLEQKQQYFLHPRFEHLDKDCSFIRETALTTGCPLPDQEHFHTLNSRKFGLMILEPHWSISHSRLNINLPTQELRGRTRTLSYGGEKINILSVEDALLVACIVGSKSEWRSLKLVADVALTIESSPGLDWDRCWERAIQARSRRMFLLGSLLAMQIAKTSIPDSVHSAAMADKAVAKLARNILRDAGNESVPTRVDPIRFSFRMIQLRENRRDQWRYFVDSLTAPSRLEVRLFPLPQPLWFLYRFIVPFTRYVAVPMRRQVRRLIRRPGR